MRISALCEPKLIRAEWLHLTKQYMVLPYEQPIMEMARAAGARGHLDRAQFLKIAMWKSRRPKPYYEKNSEPDVLEITAAAFRATNDVEKLLELTRLSGINVRAASAILHLCFPESYPLLDIRALCALGFEEKAVEKWDELQWLLLWRPYIDLCRRLAGSSKLELRIIDRALWAAGKEGLRLCSKQDVVIAEEIHLTEEDDRILDHVWDQVGMRDTPHIFQASNKSQCSTCGLAKDTKAHNTFQRFTDQPLMSRQE